MVLSAALTLAAFTCPGQAAAAGFDQKEALRGLSGLTVVVENLHPEMVRLGLTKEMVQEHVEKKLRKVGIKVFKNPKPPAMSTLYLNIISLFNRPKTFLVYNINLMLFEYAYLKRDVGSVGDLKEVRAVNWYKATIGYAGPPSIQGISKKVDELVGQFIADYLSVNRN